MICTISVQHTSDFKDRIKNIYIKFLGFNILYIENILNILFLGTMILKLIKCVYFYLYQCDYEKILDYIGGLPYISIG